MTVYETIDVALGDDHVATITINRPEVLNAFNEQMRDDFRSVWAWVRDTDDVHAVVLRAAGERAFSTGLDVGERVDDRANPWVDEARPWAEVDDPGRELGPKQNDVWKPVVAAVDGMCAGGAFYWIAECDIVIATSRATFFDPHVTYGLVAALEPILLTYRLPLSEVLRIALLGLHERMTAERALAIGFLTELVEPEVLSDRAHELAALIASQPPAAIQGTVKAIWKSLDVGRTQGLATGLLYTQVGNPLGTRDLDRGTVKPASYGIR